MSRRCVLLFSRAPRAEARAKRLREAEPLFALAHRRVARAVRSLGGTDLLVVGPPGPGQPPGARRLDQRGASFGERLANAFAAARRLGYREVVAVPGDVPGLTAAHLRAAFAALGFHPVVLGPSPDGGVYLLGTREGADRLFEGVRWCTRFVLADLLGRAVRPAVLPALADVDGAADLDRLAEDPGLDPSIRALVREIRRPSAPRPSPPDARPRLRLSRSPDLQRGPPAFA